MGTLEALIPENSDEMVISAYNCIWVLFFPHGKKEKDNLWSSVLVLAENSKKCGGCIKKQFGTQNANLSKGGII